MPGPIGSSDSILESSDGLRGNLGTQAASRQRLAGTSCRNDGRYGGGGPRRRTDRLHALACPQSDLARRAIPADHDRRNGVQRAAGCDPFQGAAPSGRPGARRSQLRVALAHPTGLEHQAAAIRRPRHQRPAVRDHRGERQHAVAGRTASRRSIRATRTRLRSSAPTGSACRASGTARPIRARI